MDIVAVKKANQWMECTGTKIKMRIREKPMANLKEVEMNIIKRVTHPLQKQLHYQI